MDFSALILARGIALQVFFVLLSSWYGFTRRQAILGNPVVLGVLLEDATLFAPTYVLESDAIMCLNTHAIRFFFRIQANSSHVKSKKLNAYSLTGHISELDDASIVVLESVSCYGRSIDAWKNARTTR